jgi:hypothetical protein
MSGKTLEDLEIGQNKNLVDVLSSSPSKAISIFYSFELFYNSAVAEN